MADLRDQLQATLGDSYTLDRELGGGGMSRVFLAEERALHRRVVIKVLPPEMAATVSMERFKREIMLAARLQHPHVVPLLSAGESDGLPYLTMPFVDGESLRARLTLDGELPVAEGVRILREVASALAYAHDQGIVHRDIKPDNVLLSRGSAMVTDFGVAKALSVSSGADQTSVTSLGIALGTPTYMSPEQAAASPNVDARADIYAFGVVAYELLAGRPPFSGRSPQALLAAHISETPEPIQKLRPSLPPPLAALIMKCLEKRPADRPQRADEVVHALDAITTPTGGSTPTMGLPSTAGVHSLARRPSARVLALASAVFLVALGAFAAVRALRGNHDSGAVMVAVLPFENQGSASDEYFADGLADAITNRLASVRTLGVIAQQSALQYKHSTKPLSQVGRELGVQYVVRGTVRWQTDGAGQRKVQVSPSLVRVSDGTVRWAAEPYVVVPSDVFAVQSDIAERVASSLDVTLTQATGGAAAVRPTANPDAYDAYLRGLEYLRQFATNNNNEINSLAQEQFARAVHLDTTFALAEANLAATLFNAADASLGDSTRLGKFKAAVTRALELDPELPEAHLAKGGELWVSSDFSGAIREFQRAANLRSGDAGVLSQLGVAKTSVGDSTGLPILARSVELSPRNAFGVSNAMSAFYSFRRYADAERYARKLEALAPGNPDIFAQEATYALSARGDTAEVGRLLEASARHTTRATIAMLIADLGVPSGTRRIEQATLPMVLAQSSYDTLLYYITKGFAYARLGRADLRAKYADSMAALARRIPAAPGWYSVTLQSGTLVHATWLAGNHAQFERDATTGLARLSATFGSRSTSFAFWNCAFAGDFAANGDVTNAVTLERACLTLPSGKSEWDVRWSPEWAAIRDRPEVQAMLREFQARH